MFAAPGALFVILMRGSSPFMTAREEKTERCRFLHTILPELRAPLASLKDLHPRDLERDDAGVFLVNALENKYTHAAKECIWPWLFPGKTAHLSAEDGGIPAVSCACNASAKGDSGGGWESQDL